MKLQNIHDVEDVLYPFVLNSKLLGNKAFKLDEIKAFLEQLDNPQDKLRVIHVAGTSGKTSTSYYIASLLHSAGLTTGLTISPHLSSITERLQINMQPISDREFCDQLEKFMPIVEKSGLTLTYFVVLVSFIYWYFAKADVDYAVVETGMGGRLDGTNTVNNPDKVCVITDIGFDHMEYLGTTLPAIAAEKAGIIHADNHVYIIEQPKEIMNVFIKRVKEVGAELHVIKENDMVVYRRELVQEGQSYRELPDFQQRNALLAYVVVRKILKGQSLERGVTDKAFKVEIPGRMEIHKLPSGQTIILDGAHNSQKMSALATSIQRKFPQQSMAVLLGMKETKDFQASIDELLPITDEAIATEFEAMQDLPIHSVEPQLLADYLVDNGVPTKVVSDYRQAVDALLDRPERLLLVTGSIYLLGQVKEYLEQTL